MSELQEALRIARERQTRRLEVLAEQLEQMKVLMSRNTRLQSEMRDTINVSRDLRKEPRLEEAPMPPCGQTGVFKITKLARAMFIYGNMACFGNATRGEVIEAFMTKLNMTKAGASSYYQQCKDSKVSGSHTEPVVTQIVESLLSTI